MSKIEERVIAKIRHRAEIGKAKYGTTLEREDLSAEQWLTHLQEELLDGANYIEKILAGNIFKEKEESKANLLKQIDVMKNNIMRSNNILNMINSYSEVDNEKHEFAISEFKFLEEWIKANM